MRLFAFLFTLLFCLNAAAVQSSVNVVALSYATTNVTTSAYVTLVTSTPVHVANLLVCDTSGKLIRIANGSVGNEVDLVSGPVNGCIFLPVGPVIKVGSRIAIKAIDASATTGTIVMSFVQ